MSQSSGIPAQQASLMEVLDRRLFERPRKVMLDSEVTDAVISAHRAGRAVAAATATTIAATPAPATDPADAPAPAPDAHVDVRV